LVVRIGRDAAALRALGLVVRAVEAILVLLDRFHIEVLDVDRFPFSAHFFLLDLADKFTHRERGVGIHDLGWGV